MRRAFARFPRLGRLGQSRFFRLSRHWLARLRQSRPVRLTRHWLARLWRALGTERPRGVWVVPVLTWRTLHEVRRDRVFGMAAEAAFWALLSLPPLALALLGLLGYVGEAFGADAIAEIRDSILGAVGQVLTPEAMNGVVRPLVNQLLSPGQGDLVSLSFLVALWSGSAAMSRYIATIVVAYDMRGLRSVWRRRLLAFVLNLGGILLGVLLLPLLVVGPDAVAGLIVGSSVPTSSAVAQAIYWPVVMVLAVCGLATLYHVGVPVRSPWRRDLPGAVLAMALWAAGSFLLRFYLTSDVREAAYGPLAAPIAALLFLYVAALAVLVGAELNAEIDALWPVESTEKGRESSRAAGVAPRKQTDSRAAPSEEGPE